MIEMTTSNSIRVNVRRDRGELNSRIVNLSIQDVERMAGMTCSASRDGMRQGGASRGLRHTITGGTRAQCGCRSSSLMGSPPLGVIRARKTSGLFVLSRKRTLPLAQRMWNPPLNRPPSSGNGFSLSKDRSSGLVQGTGLAASTIMIVRPAPSLISSRRDPSSPPKSAPGPANT